MTFTLHLSNSHLNRLPYHLDRWKGLASIAIQVYEKDLTETLKTVSTITRNNIRFTFYVIKKKEDGSKHCTFKSVNNTIIYYQNCYVINELRNLAIETIQTSHFILVDGDGLISCNYFAEALPLATMEDNLKSYIPLLSNEKEILLFPLFQFSSEYHKVCRYKGQCKEAYFIFSM